MPGGARSGCVTDAADRDWAVVFSSVFAEPDSQVTARGPRRPSLADGGADTLMSIDTLLFAPGK
jgi:hypothetical protein